MFFTRSKPKYRIGVIDDDEKFLAEIKKAYEDKNLSIDVFLYPNDLGSFYKLSVRFDLILVGSELGGFNGANVVRRLLSNGVEGTVIMVSDFINDNHRDFNYYVSKSEVMRNPEGVLYKDKDIVEQAVEASVLLQKEVI